MATTQFNYQKDIDMYAGTTMQPNSSMTKDILHDFCGGIPFWDSAGMAQTTPDFSTCLQDTMLVWAPAAFLWIISPFFILYMFKCRKYMPLPFSFLNLAKGFVSVVLCCLVILQLLFREQEGYNCDVTSAIPPVSYTASGLKFLTYLYTIVLMQIQRHRGIKTSGIPFVFWILTIVCELIPLYSHITMETHCKEDVGYYLYFAVIWVQLVLHCFAEKHNIHGYYTIDDQNPCPEENAGILNRIWYHWLTIFVQLGLARMVEIGCASGLIWSTMVDNAFRHTVWQAYKNKFSPENFWTQTPRLTSDTLGPMLEEAWKSEIRTCDLARHGNLFKFGNYRQRVEILMRRHYFQPLSLKRTLVLKRRTIFYDVYSGGRISGTAGRVESGHMNPKDRRSNTEHTPLLHDGKTDKTIPSYLLDDNDDSLPKPNLYKTLLKTFYHFWVEATTIMCVGQTTWLLQPMILRFIISMIENKNTLDAKNPAWQGYFYAGLLFLVMCMNTLVFHVGFHHVMTLGLKVKTALICLIYKKALTMKRSETKSTTVGEIVNLMSVDCQRIQDAFLFSFYIVTIFIILIIAIAELWDLMGVASLGGLAVVLLLLPVTGFIATKQHKLQKRLLYLKGTRNKILNEVISGIKVLKMYAWEPSFIKKIREIRNREIDCLWKYAGLTSTTIVFAVHSPFMILFILVLIYVMRSPTHSLGAEETFTALAIVNILRFPIALCPILVNGAVQALVSVGRIQEFLRTEDIREGNVQFVKNADDPIEVKDANFTWTTDIATPTLRSINLKVREGQIIAVVGHVGSGKSSLIQAILGEMDRVKGDVTIQGSLAYVPQEAWIQNMTLRDNILFGKDYNERKYNKVLEACALLPDLKILSGGDMTEIGEKGINISGGQKQRVSLARAVYNNADIYLMDDPLSAVDSHVGKHLYKEVIGNQGLLRHKTRVLVTHGVHWLPMVDCIIVMSDGVISEVGSYSELISHDGVFAQFLHQYLTQEDSDDEDDIEVELLKDKIWSHVEEIKSDGGLTSDDGDITTSGRRRRRSSSKAGSMLSVGRSLSRQRSIVRESVVAVTSPETLSRLTLEETAEQGTINPKVILTYFKAMGVVATAIVFITMSLFQGLNVYSNFWLTYWTEDEILKNTSLSGTPEYENKYLFYLLMYLLWGVLQGIFVFTSFYLALTRMVKASATLHDMMLNCILRSPMSFFDTTPIGRMLNRFSSDIDIMDNKLPESFRLWVIMIFNVIAVVVVICVTTPIFIAAIVPIGIFYMAFVKFYLPTARQMRRTESICRTPIYNHFSETITGASVIRAYRCADRFVEESRRRVDKNIKFFFAANTGGRWVGVRLETIGNIVALLATVFALAVETLNGAEVGLSITYAVQITITLNLVVLAISEMEMNIVSAERVAEYTELPPEADWTMGKPSVEWPTEGRIEFDHFTTRYRPGLDLVLKGINCVIHKQERVGIVGRTGAGKSSLALCLFRLIEAAGGKILIDGLDISQLGLHHLRTKLTILPQDPVIFSGSLRNNLDPFDRYQDDGLWRALECAHLKTFVLGLDGQLGYECGEGGQNLSVGQRQLVCLARTLLHKTRVLILDEATAAVDMETDDLIQDTIRTQFKECTIITVAHRLNTIMDYDRVMVLDHGLIKEFDKPHTLLADTGGVFYGMAKDAGLV